MKALYRGQEIISKTLNCRVTPFLTVERLPGGKIRATVHHVPLAIDRAEHLVSTVVVDQSYLPALTDGFTSV